MARATEPGLAFGLDLAPGYAVGVVTHVVPRYSSLIWMAEDIFPQRPSIEEVLGITRWRWPVFFPVGARAFRVGAIERIGIVPLPTQLQEMPVMRGRSALSSSWQSYRFVNLDDPDRIHTHGLGHTTDRSLPIDHIVNDTALREMILSHWRPSDEW